MSQRLGSQRKSFTLFFKTCQNSSSQKCVLIKKAASSYNKQLVLFTKDLKPKNSFKAKEKFPCSRESLTMCFNFHELGLKQTINTFETKINKKKERISRNSNEAFFFCLRLTVFETPRPLPSSNIHSQSHHQKEKKKPQSKRITL